MKKVTFLMLHLNYGGIERQVTSLINELAKNPNYELTILCVYDILGKSFYELDSRVKVRYLISYGPNKKEIKETLSHGKIFSFIKEVGKSFCLLYTKYIVMKREIKYLDTDIIVSSRIEFSRMIRRTDTHNISQEHSYIPTEQYKNKLPKSFAAMDDVIVMTNKAKEIYQAWFLEKKVKANIVVIPNMIQPSIASLNNVSSNQIIAVGRLEEVKDFTTLITIFSNIAPLYPKWILKIVGEGSQKEKLESQIIKLGLENRIILTGKYEKQQLDLELENSSIFCTTSLSETFSLALVEAMEHELACISFDIDFGPREIIEQDKTGFLVPLGDTSNYQEKLSYLMNNPENCSALGKAAKQSAKQFYSSVMVEKWNKLFEEGKQI